MDWKELGKEVANFAPLLGQALGPGGAAVGAGIAAIFGTKNDPDAISAAIKNDPEAAIKLRKIESDERIRLQEIVLEQHKADLKDRQDARARDVAIKESGKANWRGDALAVIAISGLVTLILTLLFVEIQPGGAAMNVLLVLAGGLVAIVKDVYAFEFGSSRGSKDKDAVLASGFANAGNPIQSPEKKKTKPRGPMR